MAYCSCVQSCCWMLIGWDIREACGQAGFAGVPVFFLVSTCQHHTEYFGALSGVIKKQTIFAHLLSIPTHWLYWVAFLAPLDCVSRADEIKIRPLSVRLWASIIRLWTYLMDSFQILFLGCPARPYAGTILEKKILIFFNEYFPFSLARHPMRAKPSRCYSSLK